MGNFQHRGHSLDGSFNGCSIEMVLKSVYLLTYVMGGICDCFFCMGGFNEWWVFKNVAVTNLLAYSMLSRGVGGDLGRGFPATDSLIPLVQLILNLLNPLGSLITGYTVVLLQALWA